MITTLLRRMRRDDGASAVEYGLLVAAIAAIIVTVVFLLGNVLEGVFTETCQGVATETTNADCGPAGGGD